MKEEAGQDALIQERIDQLMNRNAPPQVGGRFEYDDAIDSAYIPDVLMNAAVRSLAEAVARSRARHGCVVNQP